MASETTGVLIIRAWIEPGSSEPLRARVRTTTDVSGGAERTQTFSKAEDVCAAVRAWLSEIEGGVEN
jgi:hypothetical protein